jgi:hypothetical protein
MTWCIGWANLFGYSVGISDIRVTFSNHREFDCLQKIYYIGPTLAIAFAGSVDIGFSMVEQLTADLSPKN